MGFVTEYKKVEVVFGNMISKYGEVIYANRDQDIYEHWDLKLIREGKETKFDVKACKKVKRTDENVNDEIHWVELKNVRGNHGWLYGDADYFVFETIKTWIMVKKVKLQKMIDEKCDKASRVQYPELYKMYQRYGRQDLITLIMTLDLIEISDKIIQKVQ